MFSLEQIREDLRDIRYYYAHKDVFDKNEVNVGVSVVKKKVEKYNAVIVFAPPRFYDLYVGLYVDGYAPAAFAMKSGYATNYLYKVNNELQSFFQKNLKED